ncbi:MAG: IMS domain-containing protein [Gaiellaceae bacterium]
MTSKRVLLSASALLVLLAGGLAIAQLGTQGDNDGTGTNATSPTPIPPTESPSPASAKEQVREAYLRYWDVFPAAFRKLSADDLNDVTTGKALRVLGQQIQDLREKGLFVRVRVQHRITQIRLADATTALVVDRLTNHSVTIDRATGKPTEKDPNEVTVEAYTLKMEDGIWKVSAISRR